MSGVSLQNIRKSYPKGPHILHDISLDIKPGEFVVIVGPSGCGKSTLLRLIAGLERCEEGRVMIGGQLANDIAPQDRDIAMIFQNYALYPHMTVRENIAFGLEMRGIGKAERNKRADTVAKMLQLDAHLDRKPGLLSGGQRQRVAMGRAMARNATIFLMDEPLSNLDNALRVTMRAEIKALHRQLGATMIYVTHDQNEAMSLADRVAVLKDGHLQQFGRPDEIYDRPNNRFVASFLGTQPINFVAADALPGWKGPNGLTVGLRPDMLTAHDENPGGAALPTRLVMSEMTGQEMLLHCESSVGRLAVTIARRQQLKDTENLWVTCDLERALYFDNQSGERVDLATCPV